MMKGIAFFMRCFFTTLLCSLALAISVAQAAESMKFSSQAAALAALTARTKPSDVKGVSKSDDDDDEIVEIPVDTPTISNVHMNTPVAGETGQL
jgi:hypothetical protein